MAITFGLPVKSRIAVPQYMQRNHWNSSRWRDRLATYPKK